MKTCNCLQETADRLMEKLMEKPDLASMRPRGATGIDSATASEMCLEWKSGEWVLMIPFTVNWVGSKKRETRVNIRAPHCPFCGKALEAEAIAKGGK